MNQPEASRSSNRNRTVLVVDDDELMRSLYEEILSIRYEVISATSGNEALAICKKQMPDLILLDIEMPDMNGYEVCKKLRETSELPIIFITAHQSLEEHLKAYNAGGDDIITKPIDSQNLQLKVNVAFKNQAIQQEYVSERSTSQSSSGNFLSTPEESGILLNFMRASLGCRTYESLAEKLVEAARDFEVECSVLIRHGKETTLLTTHGQATSLEQSLLEQSSKMGREFQLKNRLVINQDRISILVSNLPSDDEKKAGKIRDNILILAETAEALIESFENRQ